MDKQNDAGWEMVSLTELGELNRGRSRTRPRNAPHLYGTEYPFIQTGDITASLGRITEHTQSYSEAGLAQSRLWPAGTMCITIAANIAETGILQYPACFPDSVVGFVPDPEKADVRFIEYSFRQLKKAIQHEATGSVQDNINLETLSRLQFRLPNLVTQQAIAAVLGAFDDKIAANLKVAKLVDSYLAAKLRLEMSGGFRPGTISLIADTNASLVRPVEGGELRYIDIASVGVGSHSHPMLTAWSGAPSRARRRVKQGDTLWSTVRPGRRSHSLNLSDDPRLVASTGLAVLSPREVGFAYLYEVTRLSEFTDYLENVAEGSAYPAVRAEFFNSAPVPLLSEARRDAFETVAAPMRVHLHALALENRLLAKTRDALLPALISGDLVPHPMAMKA